MSYSNIYNSGKSKSHYGSAHYTYNDGAQHNSGSRQTNIQNTCRDGAQIINGPGNINNYNERGRTRERSEGADRQVLVAARDGSTSRIRNLFKEKDAHGWYQDENGMTALHYACASDRDDVEILEVLLGKGCADVNALNRAGESPLRLAINRKGAFSATARYLRDSGGKDLGPKPRLTSPVWRADPFALHEWTMSESPPKSRSVLLEKTFAERSRDLDLQEGTEIWESQQAAKGKFADLFGLDPDL